MDTSEIFAVLFIVGITLLVMYYPPTQTVFELVPLTWKEWLICIGAAFTTLIYMEIAKYFRRRLKW